MAPFSRLNRVAYSLSSSAVRLWEGRWLATAFLQLLDLVAQNLNVLLAVKVQPLHILVFGH